MVLVSILVLSSVGVEYAFAMGQAPSTCSNRYDGPIVSFTINNGTQKFNPITHPGATFDMYKYGSYRVTFTIHTQDQSSQGNSLDGTTWYDDDVFAFGNGYCVNGAGPNQNVMVTKIVGDPHSNYNYYTQSVYFFTYGGNQVSFTVNWVSKTPVQATKDLIKTVDFMSLPPSTNNSLDAKLNATIDSLNSGDNGSAKSDLGAFTNEVNSETGKSITKSKASILVYDANGIINNIP